MRNDMNFFIPYEGKKKQAKNKNIYLYTLVGILAVAILGTLSYNSISIVLAKKDIKHYEKELDNEDIKEKVLLVEELYRKNEILITYETQLEEIIDAVESRDAVTTEIINKISSTLPTGVAFSGISIEKDNIVIKAVSTSRSAIAEIQNNLRNLDIVSDVHVGAISGDDSFTFDITLKLKEAN